MVGKPNTKLQQVQISDDLLEYTLRCAAQLSPALGSHEIQAIEAAVRELFGGSRVYVAKRGGCGSERNDAIRAAYARGERVELIARRHGLKKTRVYQILGFQFLA